MIYRLVSVMAMLGLVGLLSSPSARADRNAMLEVVGSHLLVPTYEVKADSVIRVHPDAPQMGQEAVGEFNVSVMIEGMTLKDVRKTLKAEMAPTDGRAPKFALPMDLPTPLPADFDPVSHIIDSPPSVAKV